MQLSNIRKLELEALAIAAFLHILALLLYGIIANVHIGQQSGEHMVKINLAGVEHTIEGLEAISDSEAATPEITKNDVITDQPQTTPKGISAGGESEHEYLQILQDIVQNSSNIPPEALEQNISGKPVLRIEFDRMGKIKSYKLSQSTGNEILDNAAMKVGNKLKQKNFPPVPDDFYPDKETLKFDFGIDYTVAN